jgi:hypothetical protein
MTEKETIMPQDADEETAKREVIRIVEDGFEDIYQKLDNLHARNIHDTAVINALRAGGFSDVAEGYIDWAECIDPDAEGNETLDTVVPDPIDAPSYKGLNEEKPSVPSVEDQLEGVARIREAHAKTFGAARGEVQWP